MISNLEKSLRYISPFLSAGIAYAAKNYVSVNPIHAFTTTAVTQIASPKLFEELYKHKYSNLIIEGADFLITHIPFCFCSSKTVIEAIAINRLFNLAIFLIRSPDEENNDKKAPNTSRIILSAITHSSFTFVLTSLFERITNLTLQPKHAAGSILLAELSCEIVYNLTEGYSNRFRFIGAEVANYAAYGAYNYAFAINPIYNYGIEDILMIYMRSLIKCVIFLNIGKI